MKKLLGSLIVGVTLFVSLPSFADHKMMVGVESIHAKGSITVFKGGYLLPNDIMVGGLFGFANNFDTVLAAPFAQKTLYKNDIFRAYAEANAGFVKYEPNQSGLIVSALGGVAVMPVKTFPFEISMSFGLVLDTAISTKLTTTQGYFGNLGFGYYF